MFGHSGVKNSFEIRIKLFETEVKGLKYFLHYYLQLIKLKDSLFSNTSKENLCIICLLFDAGERPRKKETGTYFFVEYKQVSTDIPKFAHGSGRAVYVD